MRSTCSEHVSRKASYIDMAFDPNRPFNDLSNLPPKTGFTFCWRSGLRPVEYVPVHCKPSTQAEYRRSVTLFINPELGEMRISDVERKDIAKLHHDMRDKPYKALGVQSKMFSVAEVWGLRPDGPDLCRHVKLYKENK